MAKKLSKEQWEQRIRDAGAGRYEFVRWAVYGEFGAHKKCVVRCHKDGYEFESEVTSFVHGRCGCPQCAGRRRWTAEERIEQINKLENIEFVSWVGSYEDNKSKANVRCKVDGFEWCASVQYLVNNHSGCPSCSPGGYNPSKTGYLYALRSECGMYVKVGISNDPKRRHKELERSTPFKFSLVEQISGDGDKIRDLEKRFHQIYKSAGFVEFQGCTEWLVCTPQLLEELRELEDVK